MLNDCNPTTRMYPRTLNEAFPQHCDYANAIECPPETISLHDIVVSTLGVCMWIGVIYFFVKY
jgi:hypothetical protein